MYERFEITLSYNSLSLKLRYLIQYKYYVLFISIRTALSGAGTNLALLDRVKQKQK